MTARSWRNSGYFLLAAVALGLGAWARHGWNRERRPRATGRQESSSKASSSWQREEALCPEHAMIESASLTSETLRAVEKGALEARAGKSNPKGTSSGLSFDLQFWGEPFRTTALIRIWRGQERWTLNWRPERRFIHLLPGRYQVGSPSTPGFETRELEVRARTMDEVVIELQGKVDVYGRLSGAEAYPGGVKRRLELLLGLAEKITFRDQGGGSPKVDGEGFSLTYLPIARFRLWWKTRGQPSEVLTEFEFEGAPLFLDLTLPPPDQRQAAELEARVDIEVLGPGGRKRGGECSYKLLRDGYPVRLLRTSEEQVVYEPEGLRPGTPLTLEVDHPEFGPTSASFVHGEQGPLTLNLGEPTSLDVVVLGLSETRYQGRLGVRTRERSGFLDEEGRVTLKGLSPGPGYLAVFAGDQHAVVTYKQIVLAGGNQTETLRLAPLGRLVLRLHGWTAYDGEVRSARDRRISRFFEFEGRTGITIPNLPHGRYRVQVEGVKRSVIVPGPPLVIRRDSVASLRVRIDSTSGLYYRSGLRDGDHIIEVDGTPVDLFTEIGGGAHRLLIRRGRNEFELVLDLDQDRRERFVLGGTLEPSGD